MNKKYLYLISGLLLCICVLLAYQVSQAAISNPGHGTSALEGNASLNMNSNKIINLTAPTLASDAATKGYVDAATPIMYITTTRGGMNSGGPSYVDNTPAAYCPGGWTVVTSWTYITYGMYMTSYAGTHTNGWRETLCSK